MPQTKRTATGVLGGVLGLVGLSAVAGLLVTATLTPAIAVTGAAASSAITMFDKLPSYLTIGEPMLPTEIYATTSAGVEYELAQFYDQNRVPKTYEEIAPIVYDALIASEDKKFYNHGGVDLIGTLNAAASNITGASNRGGSTITQQFVKNVQQQECERAAETPEAVTQCFLDTTASTGPEGIERKLQEMRYAIALEQRYAKNDILLGYLNTVHFGGLTYGIGAAAEHYFNKDAIDLTLAEAATLVGMVQAPNEFAFDNPASEYNGEANGYAPTVDRRNYVIDRLLVNGKITEAEYDAAIAEPLVPNIRTEAQGCSTAGGAAFFCEYVMYTILNDVAFGATPEERTETLRRGGLKIYTTIDLDLQAAAEQAMSIVPATLPDMNLGATGVQVEVETGRILSMVQNRPFSQDPAVGAAQQGTEVNYNANSQFGASTGFSAGSTYKLFSLVNWLDQGHSVYETLNGKVGDKKVDLCDGATDVVKANNNGGIGNFQNNPGYAGTPYKFTTDSLNSGFFAMAEKISVCSTNRMAMKMGVMRGDGTALDTENFGYNVLGDQPVAPLDMAQAYATIAGKGMYCQSKAIDRIVNAAGEEVTPPATTCERVISEGVAATAAFTLEGVMNGTGQNARVGDGVPIFGKTGIHQYYHTWMIGSSTNVATAIWVGNVEGLVEQNYIQTPDGMQVSQLRNPLFRDMQGAANAKYDGERFPDPDQNLLRKVYVNLPDVTGRSIGDAEAILEDAGFEVSVGAPVEGSQPEGTVARQDPGAGRVTEGSVVTISPSNGQGGTLPGGLVGSTQAGAQSALRDAGFSNVTVTCVKEKDAPKDGRVTAVSPEPGSAANKATPVTITVERETCS